LKAGQAIGRKTRITPENGKNICPYGLCEGASLQAAEESFEY